MGRQLHWQLLGLENLTAHGVGQRNFRGRNQVQILTLVRATFAHGKHVVFKLRQLARTKQRFRIDDVRRVTFRITMLLRLGVEHELRDGAMQPGDRAAHQREACAGQFRTRCKIQAA